MKAPTLENLLSSFRDLTREQARLIRKLAHSVDDREALAALIEASCPETHAYARSCYSDPYDSGMWRRTMALHAIDRILGTCGVEALGPTDDHRVGYAPPFEYCNAGDTYATTLIYKRDSDRLFVGCWGDVVERHEKDWGEETF